jgi:predicted permease
MVRNTLRSLFLRRQAERDLEEEFQDHLQRQIESNIRAGMAAEEARFAALRLIGPISFHLEECRDWRGTAFLEACARDARYGVQMLRRTPLFTAAAVVTLALGIGANTTVFTFVDNILLSQAPVQHPEQLVFLNWGQSSNLSYPNYIDFRDRNRTFSSLIACRYNPVNLSVEARENYRAWGYEATGNYFETLGVKPLLGRFFGPAEDDRPGANLVVVISHRLWQGRFAADPSAIGRKVKINGHPFTIIGVAPPGFTGTELIVTADYWVPMTMELQIEPGNDWIHSRGAGNAWTLGRLKPRVSRAQAEADLNRIAQDLAHIYPDLINRKTRFSLSSPGLMGKALRGPITGFGVVMTGVGGIVLLLACVNLAGMLIARATDRRHEIAIRLSLGAGKVRMLRQLMTESLLLAVSGGLLGFGLACAACRWFSSWHPAADIPVETALHPDWSVFCFTAVVTLSTTLLFGLMPALQAMRTDLIPGLKNAPADPFGRWNVRDVIVTGQIALSVILVICSVLVVRSLQHALTMNLGFDPTNAVAVSFDLRLQGYSEEQSNLFHTEVLDKVAAIAGMQSVGIIDNLPLRIGEDTDTVSRTDGPVPPPSERHSAIAYKISPGYLRAAGTRLLAGRDVSDRDRKGSPPVAIVNQALVDVLFPKENPLGKRFRITANLADPGIEIIGVVETGKYESLGEETTPAFFQPIRQTGTLLFTTVVARTPLPSQEATKLLRKAVLDLDPELTLFNAGGLQDQLALPLFPARAAAIVLGIFGLLAMVLAATGLFALMAYAVARRTREIGIRMALGARPGQVLLIVLRRISVLCAIGVSIGTLATLAGGRLLSAILYGISLRDPVTYTTATLLMAFVAFLACWNPAARAIRVDPARTLRED